MYLVSGSHSTCHSARRRGLFASSFNISNAHLSALDPSALLEIIKQAHVELSYTKLENAWITSFLRQHHTARHANLVRFQPRQYTSEDRTGANVATVDGVNHATRPMRQHNSDPTNNPSAYSRSYASSSVSRKSDPDDAMAVVNITYKLLLCEEETTKIDHELKHLLHATTASQRKTIARTANDRFTNEEACRTLKLFHEFVGAVKEHDKRAHREQRNRMLKFIKTRLSKNENHWQRLNLHNIRMQNEIRALLELIEERERVRGEMESAELSQTQFDIRQMQTRLRQLEHGVLLTRKQHSHVGLERNAIGHLLIGSKKQSELLDRQLQKVQAYTESYDAAFDEHRADVSKWRNLVRSKQFQIRTTGWPTIDEYMAKKRQLAGLDCECATLQRVARVAKIKLDVAHSKLKTGRRHTDLINENNRESFAQWLHMTAA